jgi:hypothetical protein
MPSKVRQTKATKASARLFGMAASMSAALRQGLKSILPDDKGQQLQYRLNTALLQWLRLEYSKAKALSEFSSISGFEFNQNAPLSLRLRVRVSSDWKQKGRLLIHIPALTPTRDIAAPRDTQTVLFKIAAASCKIENPSTRMHSAQAEFEIPYKQAPVEARQIEIPFSLNRGDLAVVVVALHYRVGSGPITSRSTWLPSAIVASAYYQ